MRIRKSSRRRVLPEPWLLPLDAYPAEIDEAGRTRLDLILIEKLPTIPVEPNEYLDGEGERWILNAEGAWADKNGVTRSSLYTPIISIFGPFTRATPEPDGEEPAASPVDHG